jgi:error-prone DNA polymerase
MAAWKKTGRLMRHREKLLEGFRKKGISRAFGEALFEQIKGFGDYGFPESHASSFALLVYASAWEKAHYPAHFACAVLNSQPMGFYSPSTLVRDAQKHGVEVRDTSVTSSLWDCTLEEPSARCRIESKAWGAKKALRLGLRLVKGLGQASGERIERVRQQSPFVSLDDFLRRTLLRKDEIEALAEAGALEGLVTGRRQALWRVKAPRVAGLFEALDFVEPEVELPPLRAAEQLILDYGTKGLSVNDHPLRHLRARLQKRRVIRAEDLVHLGKGTRVSVAGLVLSRQRPGTASGVVFITLEDETGFANLIVYRRVFEQFHWVARHSTLLLAHGEIEREEKKPPAKTAEKSQETPVIHVIVHTLERLDRPGEVQSRSRDFH